MNSINNFLLSIYIPLANDPFKGVVKPPAGAPADAAGGASRFLSVAFQLFITVATLSAFVYLMWGVLDWITSGGEPDKLSKARAKMAQALIGILMLVVALGFFLIFAGGLTGDGLSFLIPQFKPAAPAGSPGTPGGIPAVPN